MQRLALALTLAALAAGLAAPGASALGGPVILGGDDLTDHGSRSGGGASVAGWLYIERAVGNLRSNVTKANDNTIAVVGSADPGAAFPAGNAGAAIKNAAQKNGMGVRFFNGAAAINFGMSQISNGSYRPAIVWIAGNEADNDLDACEDSDPSTTTEGDALVKTAFVIDNFVAAGGGLMSHGSCYGWLSTLLPGLTTVDGGSSGDLYITPLGASAFPGLTNPDVNSGPWHNFFQGNLGGLGVLVRSANLNDSAGVDAAVIIGGSSVTLTPRAAAAPPVTDRTRPRIRILGVRGRGRCTGRNFTARIRIADASALQRAEVFISGKRVRRTTRKAFSVRVRVRGLRSGRNRISVVARDTAGNQRLARVRFKRCPPPSAAPRFTG